MVSGKRLFVILVKISAVSAIMGYALFLPLPSQARQTDMAGQLPNGTPLKKVYVGLYENKPKVFTDESGHPSGIFIEILEEIAREEQWELVYVPCSWSECFAALEEGRIDLMPDVAFSQERERRLDFNEDQVIESWSQVYSHSWDTVNNLSDLDGKRIALLDGSIQNNVLQDMMNGFGYEVTFIQTDSYEEAFSLAAQGNADAAVSNHYFGDYAYQQYGLAKTPIVFNHASLYFAAAQGRNPDLLMAIGRNLRSMKSEPGSVYYRALAKWMERPPAVVIPRYLLWIIAGISVFLVLAFIIIALLRFKVRARTAHLLAANETLRESEEKYRSLFETMAQGVVCQDAQGVITSANPAAERILGLPVDNMIGLKLTDPLWNAFNEDGSAFRKEEFPPIAALDTGRRVNGVIMGFRQPDKDAPCWILVDATPEFLQGETKPYRVHTIFADITERKRTEEALISQQRQLQQAQKMESVGRLAGGVAHDFNNLLSVIMGFGEMVLEDLGNGHPHREALEHIVEAGLKARDLTRQLLAFSRKQDFDVHPLDINIVVKKFERMLSLAIGVKITLELDLCDEPCPVMADAGQLEQVFMNLAVNARDAMPEGGRLGIKTSHVEPDKQSGAARADSTQKGFVEVSITDTGSGMDRAVLEHLFEPFFTTKEEGKGTGLGLATSYGIIKQHGGSILVESDPGKGTTFRIYLPLTQEDVDSEKTGITAVCSL